MEHSELKLYAYKNCSTCRAAKNWLKANGIAVDERDILEYPPSTRHFYHWVEDQGIPVKRFYNTSGDKYRELNMKDRVNVMSLDEQVALLASHGKLVKRPILTDGNLVLIGFNEAEWAALLLTP
ncbi:MAG: arsenate reductase family protein [Clostridiaceae bacterium]